MGKLRYLRLCQTKKIPNNMNNNQNSAKTASRASVLASNALIAICRAILMSLLWVAKNIWKRYFGIETPVYKLWWKTHAENMQKKLDKVHRTI